MATTASASQPVDVLDQLFQGLRSRSPDTQAQSAIDLQHYVCNYLSSRRSAHVFQISNTVPELSSDAASKLWEEIINKIFDLVHSQTTAEKLGGILAIGALFA